MFRRHVTYIHSRENCSQTLSLNNAYYSYKGCDHRAIRSRKFWPYNFLWCKLQFKAQQIKCAQPSAGKLGETSLPGSRSCFAKLNLPPVPFAVLTKSRSVMLNSASPFSSTCTLNPVMPVVRKERSNTF